MTPAVTAWTSWFGDRVVRPCANPVGRGRTFHHFMRLNAIAGLLVIVLASMSATAEVRLPKDVEKVLRDNGLSPRSRPAWNEKYSILIRGTEQKPELLTGTCPSRPRGRQSIQGKRFTYEADNRGEWGGDLNVREGGSPKRSVVRGNTRDLITLSDDLYVFTGLSMRWRRVDTRPMANAFPARQGSSGGSSEQHSHRHILDAPVVSSNLAQG